MGRWLADRLQIYSDMRRSWNDPAPAEGAENVQKHGFSGNRGAQETAAALPTLVTPLFPPDSAHRSWRLRSSAPSDVWHLGRHNGHELDVGFKR
jgi:hypothetical protein